VFADSSYSAVLQSGPAPGKMPIALMPSAAPPGSYVQDNRTKQIYPTTNQVSSASRSPNTTYVYSPKGMTSQRLVSLIEVRNVSPNSSQVL